MDEPEAAATPRSAGGARSPVGTETGQHAGHADILRGLLDGATGR
ncbi:hypothetical protein [Streptomyces sp. NPDC096030]